MLGVAIGSFLLLLIVVYLIAAPALTPDPADEALVASALKARKEQLLSDIRELDADLATGKLEEEDHRRFRARALAEAAETIQRLDELEVSPAEEAAEPDDPGDAIEAAISARRLALEVYGCPECAELVDPADAFCRRCGTGLTTGVLR